MQKAKFRHDNLDNRKETKEVSKEILSAKKATANEISYYLRSLKIKIEKISTATRNEEWQFMGASKG